MNNNDLDIMNVHNYITFKGVLPWRIGFMYVDIPEYQIDDILDKYNIKVRYGNGDYVHKMNKSFVLSRFTTNKKNYATIVNSVMPELDKKLYDTYGEEYKNFVNQFYGNIISGIMETLSKEKGGN